MMFRPIFVAALLSLPAVGAALGNTADQPVSRSVSVEQMPMHAISPAVQSIAVNAVLDRPTGTYDIGEAVGLSVSVSQPAHLTVFNVGPDGRTTVLFPNRFHRDSRVDADRTIQVPGTGARLVARAPAGTEMIKVIASAHPIDVASLAEFREIEGFDTTAPREADTVARSLGVVAAQGIAAGAGAWGEAVLTVRTRVPQQAAPHPTPISLTPISVEPFDQPFNLHVAPTKPAFQIGEPIALTVEASERCTLTVLSFGPSGAVGTIIPADPSVPQVLEPGRPMRIAGAPGTGAFVAAAPAGTETIRAFCSAAALPPVARVVTASAAGESTMVTRDVQIQPAVLPTRPAARIAEAVAAFDVVE